MNLSHASAFLRRCLLVDAAVTGSCGLLLLAAALQLEGPLGISAALLRAVGIVLLPFAAAVLHLARREAISRPSVLAVVTLNVAWVAGSLLLLVSDRVDPTTLGVAFVILQAVLVAGFAELQYVALRRVTIGAR